MDYSIQILESLPANARQYYTKASDKTFTEWTYQVSLLQKVWRTINLIRIYPLFSMTYVNSNELICVIVNGEHRIYQGPGFQWVVGLSDRVFGKFTVGSDISFGPIKVIYVSPGTLKFAKDRSNGRPMLLGPGMHYFNDLNIEIKGDEISMNFHGDNQSIAVDDMGAFQFTFVRTGSEGIVINKDGEMRILGPGLHFLQSPDSLKCFVSIQQEHFKFGSHETNQYFLTADNVELFITATLFYRIVDVKSMFTTRIKDHKDLLDTLHSQAMATLLTIIRSENFSNIGRHDMDKSVQRKMKPGFDNVVQGSMESKPDYPVAVPVPTAPPMMDSKSADVMESITTGFQSIIHDAEPQFQKIMQTNFGSCGIEIQSLRIEQIEFADKTMQKQISEFAMTFTKLTAQQQTIKAQRAIQVAEAEREAATLLIKTKAESDKQIMLMETQNKILIQSAKAQAENQLIKADAEAQAKLKIGEAEIEIMKKQNDMPNAQLRIVTDAQKEVLRGIQKVIYTDQQSMLLKPYMAMPDIGITTVTEK